jgi:hypothetical protein
LMEREPKEDNEAANDSILFKKNLCI